MTRRAALAGALVVALGAAAAADATLTQSQVFFRTRLLTETTTSKTIKDLLRSGGFVDKSIAFYGELFGWEHAPAGPPEESGGAAGAVAVYVFSTAAGGQLRTVFRSQKLTRASTTVKKGVLSYDTARYAPGDELCCPSKLLVTTLRWDAKALKFRVAKREETTPATAPAPAPG